MRVAIACALVRETQLLLMDEPLRYVRVGYNTVSRLSAVSGLDSTAAREVHGLLHEVCSHSNPLLSPAAWCR